MHGRPLQLRIIGMRCGGCVDRVERALTAVDGVERVEVNLATGTAAVVCRDRDATGRLIAAARLAGYDAAVVGGAADQLTPTDGPAAPLGRSTIVLVAALAAVVQVVDHLGHAVSHDGEVGYVWLLAQGVVTAWILASVAGRSILVGGWRALVHRTPSMDLLVSIAVTAAFLSGLLCLVAPAVGEAHFHAAAMIVAFISIGRHLEARAKRDASAAIVALSRRMPKTAIRIEDGISATVPADQVSIGDRLKVPQDTVVPVDGCVLEGAAGIDESAVTGESVPVPRGPGDLVRAGGLVVEGLIVLKATATAATSSVGRILQAVRDAQAGKTRMQRIADRVAGVFVPIVLGLAVLTLAGWLIAPAAGWVAAPPAAERLGPALRSALAVLVIACPCAMGLATPVAVLVATGSAALRGILVRDVAALEAAGRINAVLLDKTGTLTTGCPTVKGVFGGPVGANALGERGVLEWAASAEQLSQHPLARAIVAKARESGAPLHDADTFTNDPGLGIAAKIGGRSVLVGSAALMAKHGIDISPVETRCRQMSAEGQTVAVLAIDGVPAGLIGLADTPRPGASQAIRRLVEAGIEVVMVTGDQPTTAGAIAAQLGITDVHAQMLPEQKLAEVRRRQDQRQRVAFVGDGINDAPALTAADVGIAFATGTDVAVESADITLLRPDLALVPDAIDLARRSVRIIKQNLFWAFFYNMVAVPLAAVGAVPPGWAAAAMMLSSLSVVLNSLRLRGQVRIGG